MLSGESLGMPRADLATLPLMTKVRMLLWFCLIAGVLVAAGFIYYSFEFNQIQQSKSSELSTIGEMKVGQILRWRRERAADMRAIAESPMFLKQTAEWLRDQDRRVNKEALLQQLQLEHDTGIYFQALLVDGNQTILLSAYSQPAEMEIESWETVARALAEHHPVFSQLHNNASGKIHIDIAEAIQNSPHPPGVALVLTTNAYEYLFPLIQSWPTPSRSGETLLVSRDGDEVVFLNELRFRKGTALNLRFPLTRTDLPATQAVLGRRGIFYGKDYRNVKVLADLRPVPGTSWYLVTKEDEAEIQREARFYARTVFIVVFILIGCVAAAMVSWYLRVQVVERKRKEEALKKVTDAKSKFSSMVSHELRSPLAVIKEALDIVSEGVVGSINGEQKELLDIAKRNTDRLSCLINNVLDFQKIESGKMEFYFLENDLNETVMEAHKSMSMLSARKGLDLRVKVDRALPRLKFDRDKVIQVLVNLLSNAIKNTEIGSVTIATVMEAVAVHVLVQDTGCGIAVADIPKLFQPFEQVESSRGRKVGGTGLGLAISREIILAHHGKIWAESAVGKGSTFHFTLPLYTEGL